MPPQKPSFPDKIDLSVHFPASTFHFPLGISFILAHPPAGGRIIRERNLGPFSIRYGGAVAVKTVATLKR
jgi:hypothetical protein